LFSKKFSSKIPFYTPVLKITVK